VTDDSESNGPIIDDFGKRETILGYAALLFHRSDGILARRQDFRSIAPYLPSGRALTATAVD
jgi:hypothetical protein